MINNNMGLTLSDLVHLTGCPYYTINHLRRTNRLPMIKKAEGKGSIAIYHPDAVEVINAYLRKRGLDG
jgi:hypothetical protein